MKLRLNNIFLGIYSAILVVGCFAIKVNGQTWYRQSGGTFSHSYQSYSSAINDTSGVFITNTGKYTLSNSRVTTSGNTTNIDSSGRSGQNAGVLINKSSSTTLNYDTIITSGYGGNGIFSTGVGALLVVSNSKISTTGTHSRGIVATYNGSVTLTNTHIVTTHDTSSAIATDCAGGTINFIGGTATTSGNLSAGVYSTGDITISSSIITSVNENAAVTDVDGKLTISNSTLNGGQHGLMVHKTVSGAYTSVVSFLGSTINTTGGHIVYDTAASLNVTFGGSDTLNAGTGYLIYAISAASVNATLKNERLTGNVYADVSSTVGVSLENNTLLNAIITNAAIKLDTTSNWSVNGHSHIATLTDLSGVNTTSLTVSNIIGNGNNVYYNASLSGNSWLSGKTYSLINGGCLLPEGAVCSTSGISELSSNVPFQFYPNPVFESGTVVSQVVGMVNYKIIQPDGRIVLTGTLKNGQNDIDVTKLSKGLYFFTVMSAEGQKTIRFIKE